MRHPERAGVFQANRPPHGVKHLPVLRFCEGLVSLRFEQGRQGDAFARVERRVADSVCMREQSLHAGQHSMLSHGSQGMLSAAISLRNHHGFERLFIILHVLPRDIGERLAIDVGRKPIVGPQTSRRYSRWVLRLSA